MDQPTLRDRWQTQAEDLGWTPTEVLAAIRAGGQRQGHLGTRPLAGWAQAVGAEAVTAAGRTASSWSRADLVVQVAARMPAVLRGSDGALPPTDAITATIELVTDQALADQQVTVPLGDVVHGVTPRASDARYASVELLAAEQRILDRATSANPDQAPFTSFPGSVAGLGADQQTAVAGLLSGRDPVAVVVAPAGAGKTTMLGSAVQAWQAAGVSVVGLAPSARAAAELGNATGVDAATVAKWLHHHDTPNDPGGDDTRRLAPGTVVIVDEASMLNTFDLDALTAATTTAGARLILVGDPAQIGAVHGPGGMLAHLADRLPALELTTVRRFSQPWEADASLRLRDGDSTVLAEYERLGRIHPETSSADAADAVFHRWQAGTAAGRDVLMTARSWADVDALNTRARTAGVAAGQVNGPVLLDAGGRDWRAGDVLLTRRNNSRLRLDDGGTVRNGDRYTVTGPAPGGGLEVTSLTGRGRTVLPADYVTEHARYGWACTIDAAQGATCDEAVLLARPGLDREHLYVALTRGRHVNHVHVAPDDNDSGDQHEPAPPRGRRVRADVSRQLRLPDPDAALATLVDALNRPGAQHAASALLDRQRRNAAARHRPAPPRPAMPVLDPDQRRRIDRTRGLPLDGAAAAQPGHAEQVRAVEAVRAGHLSRRLDLLTQQQVEHSRAATAAAELQALPAWAIRRRRTAEETLRHASSTGQHLQPLIDAVNTEIDRTGHQLRQLQEQQRQADDQENRAWTPHDSTVARRRQAPDPAAPPPRTRPLDPPRVGRDHARPGPGH